MCLQLEARYTWNYKALEVRTFPLTGLYNPATKVLTAEFTYAGAAIFHKYVLVDDGGQITVYLMVIIYINIFIFPSDPKLIKSQFVSLKSKYRQTNCFI